MVDNVLIGTASWTDKSLITSGRFYPDLDDGEATSSTEVDPLQIEEGSLTQGETWAVMRILQWLNQHLDGEATDPRRAAYSGALSRNDRRIAEFMKSTWADLSRDQGQMEAVLKRVDTIRKETDDLRRHG